MRWQDWARANGIDGRSLRWWSIRLQMDGCGSGVPELVELVPSEVAGSGFVVRAGEFEIEVERDFDAEALFRLLQVVRSC